MNGFLNFFNSISQFSPNGKLALKTDKGFYVAGENITGKIFAQIYQPIQCNSINMKIKGYEKGEWLSSHTRNVGTEENPKTEHYYKKHVGRKVFFEQNTPLYMVNGFIQPGSYEWPFQYLLPTGLPGSFHERREAHHLNGHIEEAGFDHDHWYDSDDDFDEETGTMNVGFHRNRPVELLANVVYKVTAVVDVAGMFAKDLFAKQPIIIHERLLESIQPVVKENTATVCLCCCIPRGEATLKCQFSKSAYCPGEQAQIIAEIKNDSEMDAKNMVVKLMRTLRLHSDDGVWGASETLVEEVSRNTYDGVPAHETKTMELPLDLVNAKKGVLQPTTNGSVVKNEYRIDVEMSIDYAPDIEVQIPCVIYVPQPPQWGVMPQW